MGDPLRLGITLPPILYMGRGGIDCSVLGVDPSSEFRRDLPLRWMMVLTLAPRRNDGALGSSGAGESMALDNVRGR